MEMKQEVDEGGMKERTGMTSAPSMPHLLLETAVISGKESSRRTCSCSSTK